MGKLYILGTLAGLESENNYTTCFILENNNKFLLVDSGSSDRLVFNMKKCGFKIEDIHNIFISHKHSDHLLGMISLLRRYCISYYKNKLKSKINIYCNYEVKDTLITIINLLFRKSMIDNINNFINFIIVEDGDIINIEDNEYKFFDCHAKDFYLTGFETIINNKKLIFLGDEKLNPALYDKVKNTDYVLSEVFCLDKNKTNPDYGKAPTVHGTVKETAEVFNKLNVKNIIFYHTTEENNINRKKEYTNEAKIYFYGNIYVPNDLDIINIK